MCSVCWSPLSVGTFCWRCCEVLEVSEVIRCVLLCMLEAMEGWLCLVEELEVRRS